MTTPARGIRTFEDMDTIGHLVGIAAASPWALALMAAALIVDGFFPFIPGEMLVVAVASAATAAGHNPLVVLAVAIPAALAGDLIAYQLGRRLGIERWAGSRHPKLARAFAYSRSRLESRPASTLLTAKFLPFVRVAATMTAGAARMPVRRYVPVALTSVTLYTGFNLAVGALVGSASFGLLANPLVSLGVSLVIGLAVGIGVDGLMRLFTRRGARAAGAALV
ncbi:DedA family protein [Gryllotalpicola reticulitermitis]|uniref:DedA family protein n=1 Tax=Gryllotalpicola reticulitermitis TaxID=1184153 RepID=A0ABV8Q3Q3_9MICO